jgi:Uma2 family endonuclease
MLHWHLEEPMSIDARPKNDSAIIYPDSDGQPMAENTLQYEWIMILKGNLDAIFAEQADVFVAGDLLWYPVEGEPEIRRAPDVLVAIGRPKGYRGSYMQWREGGVAPQVVFEVLSPGNTASEMARKFEFYDIYGVEEYYLYDPDHNDLSGWQRRDGVLRLIGEIDGWVSPLLGVRFMPGPETLRILRPDGEPFLSFVELDQRASAAEERASAAEERASAAEERAALLEARLRALGIDPQH